MARSTSISAFQSIIHSGLLSERREEVFSYLWEFGPLTGAELDAKDTSKSGNLHKRLPELREMNLAREAGLKVCRITGMEVIAWEAMETPVEDIIPFKAKTVGPRARTMMAARKLVEAIEGGGNASLKKLYLDCPELEELYKAYRAWKPKPKKKRSKK